MDIVQTFGPLVLFGLVVLGIMGALTPIWCYLAQYWAHQCHDELRRLRKAVEGNAGGGQGE